MNRIGLIVALLSPAALVAPTASQSETAWGQSETACAPRAELVAKLGQEFNENQQAIGVVDQYAVLEVFVSPENASWTIIATGTDGNSCVVSAGENWESTSLVEGSNS